MKNKKVYIAGKVSGLNYDDVVAKFTQEQAFLMFHGYVPVNPTQLCQSHWSWLHCMIVCLWHLARCRYIYLLPDWKDSRGARIERKFARLFNIHELQF